MVPLISGTKTGPLGIVHLPRLWWKMRLHDAGVLPDGYRHGSGGFDSDLFEAIGIDGDAFAGFIAGAPDYAACEGWVRAHAGNLTADAIRDFNEYTLTLLMPEPRRTEWTARFGLAGGADARAVALNHLDDWDGMHRLLQAPAAPATPLVPAISSSVAGPLGVLHLPRLWLKHRLHGAGRLAEGYRHGVGGFDEILTDALGIDAAAFAKFVESEQPDYLAAEVWVRRYAKTLTDETIAALNARFNATNLPAEMLATRLEALGPIASGLERSIPLNDLDDWAGLHRQLNAIAR